MKNSNILNLRTSLIKSNQAKQNNEIHFSQIEFKTQFYKLIWESNRSDSMKYPNESNIIEH